MRPTASEIREWKQQLQNQKKVDLDRATRAMAERSRESTKANDEAQAIVAQSVKDNERKIVANRYQKENSKSHTQVESWSKPHSKQIS